MDATTIGILAAALLVALDRFGLLDRFKPKSVNDFESELKLADRKLVRLEAERTALALKVAALEKERSNAPVLDVIAKVLERVDASLETQALVVDKLGSFNGTLTHLETGLRDATEGLKTVVGFIAELHDIPLDRPTAKRSTGGTR